MAGDRRRRGKTLEHAILVAAWAELREHGWAGFSVPRVADRAGTGKASVYSRWPTRASLAVNAAVHHAVTDVPSKQVTGSLDADLTALLEEYGAFLVGPWGDAFRALASEPAAARHVSLGDDVEEPVIKPVSEIVAAAVAARELGEGGIPARVLNLGPALVNEHFLRCGAPPSAEVVDDMVRTVWGPCLRLHAG